MIEEILQKDNPGLGNIKTEICVGFDHYDATADIIFEKNNFYSYKPLAEKIFELYPNAKNILELGCGAGVLSYHYRNLNPNIKYVTVDINQDVRGNNVVKDEHHFILFTDRPFQIQENKTAMNFDLILSFEHFEHIPYENIFCFLENIKRHSHPNTIVISTAALWVGTDGRHPLVLDFHGWSKLLEENGFEVVNNTHSFVTTTVVPYNFEMNNSVELVFKIK